MDENKKFVSIGTTDETKARLIHYSQDQGFDVLARFDGGKLDRAIDQYYHITVFYSNNYPSIPLPEKEYELPVFEVKPISFELLVPNNNILSLVIEQNYSLNAIYECFSVEFGLKSDFPVWKPHITVDYDYKGDRDLSKLKLPDFPIEMDILQIKNQ